jgi:hypothetical protein
MEAAARGAVARSGSMASLIDVLTFLIEKGPGRTQRELAEAIFGKGAQPSRVQYELGVVVRQGTVARRGNGDQSDPFKYFPSHRSS